ncbi:unnamed protein product [Schistosoma turkestanicum]|nr:unnamed protein product [Schistosoma turkestanicum]
MTELVELNNQLRIAEEEARKWKKLIEPILKIETEINKLNSTLLSKEEPFSDETEPLSSDTTIDGVCDFLHSMHNKIQILHANACAMKKTDKITSDICTQVCVVNTSQTSSDKHCVQRVGSRTLVMRLAEKFDTCLQAEVPLPPMVSSNAANRELPTYTNFAKEAIDQASVLKNIDLKGLIHAEILRVLSEQNHCFSTPNTTASLASVPVDNLLAPVAKTSPKQSVTPIANSVPSAPSILNLWPHLSFGGVSSKHVPPPLPESEELISPSEEVTGMSTINEFNLTSSSDNGPESYRNGEIPSESKTLMPSFLTYIGGFVRRQIQQLSESQISDSNYGSWLSELGLNPCEESFNKPIERPSVPSFSVDEEQPWCPGCHRMFPSRADLEEHFNDCLL